MSKYIIECSITPVCPSCGKDIGIGSTLSKPYDPSVTNVLDRDNPFERAHRRVFVYACDDCFVHRSKVKELKSEGQR